MNILDTSKNKRLLRKMRLISSVSVTDIVSNDYLENEIIELFPK
jgi:hypothetical protein